MILVLPASQSIQIVPFHDYKTTNLIGFRDYTNMVSASLNPLKPSTLKTKNS